MTDVTGRDEVSDFQKFEQLGRRDFFFSCSLYFFHIHAPLLTVGLCYFLPFQYYCSNAHVFGRTVVHEFLNFYSTTEWNMFYSLYDSGKNILYVPARGRVGRVTDCGVRGLGFKSPVIFRSNNVNQLRLIKYRRSFVPLSVSLCRRILTHLGPTPV